MKDSPQGKATRNLSKQVPLGSFFSNTHSFVCLALRIDYQMQSICKKYHKDLIGGDFPHTLIRQLKRIGNKLNEETDGPGWITNASSFYQLLVLI